MQRSCSFCTIYSVTERAVIRERLFLRTISERLCPIFVALLSPVVIQAGVPLFPIRFHGGLFFSTRACPIRAP